MFHNKFGPGAVVAVDGPKLTVDFDKAGRKLVMDSFVAAEGSCRQAPIGRGAFCR